jgi:ABC-type phosphate transport system substrate-binding protein
MRITTAILLVLAMLAGRSAHAGDIVVIVNLTAAPISKQELADLYLGRDAAWTPVDQSVDSNIYTDFYKKATGRDTAQVKAIWSRIIFTGRGLLPKQLHDSEAVKRAVAANPKVVGYIEKSAVDATVKVALTLD